MLKLAQHSLDAEHAPAEPNSAASEPITSGNVRATLYVDRDVLEAARNAAVYLAGHPAHLTLTRLVDTALRAELARLHQLYHGGQPFPRRAVELKGGRPIAA